MTGPLALAELLRISGEPIDGDSYALAEHRKLMLCAADALIALVDLVGDCPSRTPEVSRAFAYFSRTLTGATDAE